MCCFSHYRIKAGTDIFFKYLGFTRLGEAAQGYTGRIPPFCYKVDSKNDEGATSMKCCRYHSIDVGMPRCIKSLTQAFKAQDQKQEHYVPVVGT